MAGLHPNAEALIRFTAQALGLSDYRLHEDPQIYSEPNRFEGTDYLMSMTWLPPGAIFDKESLARPAGTVTVKLEIHSRRFSSIEVACYAKNGMPTLPNVDCTEGIRVDGLPTGLDAESLIRSIEHLTGFTRVRHFAVAEWSEGHLFCHRCHERVRLLPQGMILITLNRAGRLCSFSTETARPRPGNVKEDVLTVTKDEVAAIAREQLKLHHYTDPENGARQAAYLLRHVLVRNSDRKVLFYRRDLDLGAIRIDEPLEWDAPLSATYPDWSVEPAYRLSKHSVTMSEALDRVPHPDTAPLTSEDRERAREAARDFLRATFPEASGQWRLCTLCRSGRRIEAILRREDDLRQQGALPTLYLDPVDFHVLGHEFFVRQGPSPLPPGNGSEDDQVIREIDAILDEMFNSLVDSMNDRREPEIDPAITPESAFQALWPQIALEPLYVFDLNLGSYQLYAELDCSVCIRADDGSVAPLDSTVEAP